MKPDNIMIHWPVSWHLYAAAGYTDELTEAEMLLVDKILCRLEENHFRFAGAAYGIPEGTTMGYTMGPIGDFDNSAITWFKHRA